MSKIHLSAKQAQAWAALDTPGVVQVFAGGGAGGGKSVLGCARQIYRRVAFPGTRGFIGRASFTALADSTMKTYFRVAEMMGYVADVHYTYNAQNHTVTWHTTPPSEQHFRWIRSRPDDPNYDRIGSTEYTDAFIDEAPEVAERAVDVLTTRLRYRHHDYCHACGLVDMRSTSEEIAPLRWRCSSCGVVTSGLSPEMLLTGNPSNSWVKRAFVMDDDGAFIDPLPHRRRVLFTVADNPDAAVRESYAQTLALADDYDRARLLEGSWDLEVKSDRPFAFAFDRARHVRHVPHRSDGFVHFSLDFNVDPFSALAARIWEDRDGPHLHVFSAARLQHASVQDMAAWMRSLCPTLPMMRVTGDRGGMSRMIGTRGTFTLFGELRNELGLGERQLVVPPNPTHLLSRSQTNAVLQHHPDVAIDPSLRRLIADLLTVSVSPDGGIVKQDRSRVDQQADELDCFRYLINTFLRAWLDRDSRLRACVQK